jgi:hypothetical protein
MIFALSAAQQEHATRGRFEQDERSGNVSHHCASYRKSPDPNAPRTTKNSDTLGPGDC